MFNIIISAALNMRNLMNQVAAKCPGKWMLVGIQLGLHPTQLDTFPALCSNNQLICFVEVFSSWEKKGSPSYSWTAIIEALKSDSVSECNLAKNVKKWLDGDQMQLSVKY